MGDSYERGYHAGYNQAKKDLNKEQSYRKGYKDALEYVEGLISVQIAKLNIGRGDINDVSDM